MRSRKACIDGAFVEETLAKNLRRFDKGGEQFYDQISALHKSVRGSDPDAALYWLVRMLDGGADPLYLARRIVRMAVEDVGLADPRALRLALDATETYERLGSPEGELALAEAVLYMAVAAKSNAVYNAYNAARAFVREDGTRPVPLHIRNAPTRLMKDLGYGKDYRYAHDEADAFAAGETYFPDGMPEVSWYRPTERGLEGKIREKLDDLRRRNAEAGKKRQMIDIQLLRNYIDAVAKRLATRGYELDVAGFEKLEKHRKDIQTTTEQLQSQRNALSKQIGQAKAKKDEAQAAALLAQAAEFGDKLKQIEVQNDLDAGAAARVRVADPEPAARKRPGGQQSAEDSGRAAPLGRAAQVRFRARRTTSTSAPGWAAWISTPARSSPARASW